MLKTELGKAEARSGKVK